MNNLSLAFQITALGMGLVFAALILLWWMMALLTSILAERESRSDLADSAPVMEGDFKARAAAIAVTIALAEYETQGAHPLAMPPTAIISPWQLGMRTRQLYQKGTPIVRKPRKVG
jgi:Na+-transporting methylmalonyl-CoA/oxaloacetate decarboxylase gamma subunit